MRQPALTIRELRTRAVVVPMKRTLHARLETLDKSPNSTSYPRTRSV